MLVVCGLCFGFGLHIIGHLDRAGDALAHDPSCTKTLRLETPATEGPGCRIVHGTIQRAYEVSQGSQYDGGLKYQHRVVFVPQGGGPAVDADLGFYLEDMLDTFRATQRAPGVSAAVEFVDGQVDFVADRFGTIGPAFDPVDDRGFGEFLLVLGGFFAFMTVLTGAINLRTGRAQRSNEG